MDASRPPEVFVFGHFRLDQRGGGLFRQSDDGSSAPVSIGARALDVLAVLAGRAGDLVSKDEIMAAVWPETVVEEANLTVQISALRRVLDQAGSGVSCIQTVAGRGYRFVVPVARHAPGLPEPPGAPLDPPKGEATEPQASVSGKAATVGDVLAETSLSRRHSPTFLAAAILLATSIAAVGWTAARTGGHLWFHNEAARPRLSIVVLPFANLSNDPEQAYFVDAIGDDLTTDLSRIAGSVVIAHSTAQTYQGKPVDVKQIGHDLDVRYVLEGSVRRMNDQVEVNAQLLDTDSGSHVWADRFNTDRRNLAEAQSEITGRLARTLNLELLQAADRKIEQEADRNPDAGDLIMRGWNLWFRPFSAATHQEAARAFERALELDPRSVDAKIGVATILTTNVGVGSSLAPRQEAARAERLLLDAIEQDANSSRAHTVLGMLRRIQNRLEESRIEFETAVALDRNNAHALLGLGQTLTYLGHPAEAIPQIERSIRLDPLDPNAAFGDWALGVCHLLLGHVDKAADLLRKARAENPRIYFFQIYLAGVLGLRGELDEARAALAEAIRLNPAVGSLTRWTAAQPWIGNPALMALRNTTVDVGLRRAGMPD